MKQVEKEYKTDSKAKKIITKSYASYFLSGVPMMNFLEKKYNHKSVWVSKMFFQGEKLKGKNS